MIPLALRDLDAPAAPPRSRRRRFGLDSPLPADPRVIERAILRHLAEERPQVVALGLARAPVRPGPSAGVLRLAAGVPELLLLLPGGRVAFMAIKPQAQDLTRSQRAFADLCRACGVALRVVRSLTEARAALDHLLTPLPERQDASQEDDLARWRQTAAPRP